MAQDCSIWRHLSLLAWTVFPHLLHNREDKWCLLSSPSPCQWPTPIPAALPLETDMKDANPSASLLRLTSSVVPYGTGHCLSFPGLFPSSEPSSELFPLLLHGTVSLNRPLLHLQDETWLPREEIKNQALVLSHTLHLSIFFWNHFIPWVAQCIQLEPTPVNRWNNQPAASHFWMSCRISEKNRPF